MLVGIANLAAQSRVLEAKRQVRYLELPIRSLLNRAPDNMPFQWSINPYRGCEFGCKYCYARYTHEYMGLEESNEFEEQIYSKAGAAQALVRDLRKVRAGDHIAIGTATDPYQPAERRFGTTRSILQVFASGTGRRLSLTSKSDLVTRDLALLKRIARANVMHVNITITSVDPELARALEPRAPHPDLRLRAVERLARAGLSVGVFANPIMPRITDGEDNLDRLAAAAADAGAQYLGGGLLFMKPCTEKVFFPFLEARFPNLIERYRQHFARDAYLRGPYVDGIRARLARIRERHGLAASPVDYEPELGQLSLFDGRV